MGFINLSKLFFHIVIEPMGFLDSSFLLEILANPPLPELCLTGLTLMVPETGFFRKFWVTTKYFR